MAFSDLLKLLSLGFCVDLLRVLCFLRFEAGMKAYDVCCFSKAGEEKLRDEKFRECFKLVVGSSLCALGTIYIIVVFFNYFLKW